MADPADTTSPSAPPTTETTTAPTETTAESTAETTTDPATDPTGTSTPESSSDAPEGHVAPVSVEDVTVSATFDKPSYATGEDMRITVRITNNATSATTISAYPSFRGDADLVHVRDWGALGSDIAIAAGATFTTTLTGGVGNPDVTTARLQLYVYDETGDTRFFDFTVPVTPTFAHAAGTAFDDRDGDARFDADEELAGVTLTWQHELHDPTTFTVTTGADGTFSLPRLPTGTYFVSGTAPDGLLVGYRRITVGKSGVDGLLFRVVRPITDVVVDLEFTKDTYRKDERPVVRVTLTNNGDLPLTGVRAYCNRSGSSQGLTGSGPGWGALAGDGVNVAPHSTLRLSVTEPMPERAYDYGHVVVGCDFGYAGIDEGNPSDHDRAAVPGMRGDVTGVIGHDGTGLADVRVVLVAEAHCPIVGETRTGADGTFAFEQVPVGNYDVYMFPPEGWRVTYGNPSKTMLIGAGPVRLNVEVEPGDATAPELPRQPADCTSGGAPTTTTAAPAPQARPAPGLASTGASVGVPVAFGVLALLAGAGALLVTRRRGTS